MGVRSGHVIQAGVSAGNLGRIHEKFEFHFVKMSDQAAKAGNATTSPSADPSEIEKFAAMAAEWWNPDGKFKPLHRFNPTRLAFIKDQVCAQFGRDTASATPLQDVTVLDVGCGGGLLCEPLTRLGAKVTGIDMAAANVEAAQLHAAQMDLTITYRHTSVEEIAASGAMFDLVLNMEVVEHVADVASFLQTSLSLVRPEGLMIVATLNRTPKAFALAIVGAEYVLRWLPRGTHDFSKFVRPEEIERALAASGAEINGPFGVSYNPLSDRWSLGWDASVNYMMVARKT